MVRLSAALLALAICLVAAAPASAQTGGSRCPATFQVLHNDRIGALSLPAGNYAVTVRGGLSCAQASDFFRQFLEDWNGRLPRPWTVNASTSSFARGSSGVGFSVARTLVPSGGGGGGRHPAVGGTCPGYFQVLHNDRIGRLVVPKGNYTITVLSTGTLSCAKAARYFSRFLQDFDGRLPRPWVLDNETGTFFRSARVAFRVEEAVGPPPTPSGGGTHPSNGSRCPGTFRVEGNDRIGRLRLPAGPYIVTLLRGRGLSCRGASRLFAEFLDQPMGNLPSPWRLNAQLGTFTRGRGSTTGFRVKPVRRVR